MELELNECRCPCWTPLEPLTRRVRLSADSVVPDTCPDLHAVQRSWCGLRYKSKEPWEGGLRVNGEAQIALLCRAEDEKSLFLLHITRPFSQEFEIGAEEETQLSLRLRAMECRMPNPRKVSVTLELELRLDRWTRGELPIETALPEDAGPGLHLLTRETPAFLLTELREKSFSLREQFLCPADKEPPEQIARQELRFRVLDWEQVGSRSVVKAELCLELDGLSAAGEPASCSFRLPFSQLLDTGETPLDRAELEILPCSFYPEWVDAVGGGKALDAELHGQIQGRFYRRLSLQTAEDAYSSRMPCVCRETELNCCVGRERGSARLETETLLPLPEDCGALLSVLAQPGLPESDREGLRVPLSLELLYRKTDGSLDSLRRSLPLEGEALAPDAQVWDCFPERCEAEKTEEGLRLRCALSLPWGREERCGLRRVTALELDPEHAWNREEQPDLRLLRREGRSLWEIAKLCRSDTEAIAACCDPEGELLLVPRE